MTVDIWGLADYPALAERLAPAATALVDAAGQLAGRLEGRTVVDVAAGTGSVAVLAAAAGAHVVACDSSPRMVELGRARTGDGVRWLEADVEDLPLPDASADVLLSSFGLIFASHHDVAVAQVRRVLAPGGLLGFTAWAADGFMARMTRTMIGFLPSRPDGPDPIGWGDPGEATARLTAGRFADVRTRELTLPWRFESAAAMTAFLQAHSPAHVAAAYAAGDRAGDMYAAVEALAAPDGGPVSIDAEYLLVTATAA